MTHERAMPSAVTNKQHDAAPRGEDHRAPWDWRVDLNDCVVSFSMLWSCWWMLPLHPPTWLAMRCRCSDRSQLHGGNAVIWLSSCGCSWTSRRVISNEKEVEHNMIWPTRCSSRSWRGAGEHELVVLEHRTRDFFYVVIATGDAHRARDRSFFLSYMP